MKWKGVGDVEFVTYGSLVGDCVVFEGSLFDVSVWMAGAFFVVAWLWGYLQRRSLQEELQACGELCADLRNENRRLKADCAELKGQITAAGMQYQAAQESLQVWKSRTVKAEERAADPAGVMSHEPQCVQVFRARDGDDGFVEHVVAYLELVLGVDIHPAVIDAGGKWQEQLVETEEAQVTAVVSW